MTRQMQAKQRAEPASAEVQRSLSPAGVAWKPVFGDTILRVQEAAREKAAGRRAKPQSSVTVPKIVRSVRCVSETALPPRPEFIPIF